MSQDTLSSALTLTGPQTIREVADTKQRILAAFTAAAEPPAREYSLDCAAVTEVDLCFLQLLIAASRSATGGGRRLTLRPPPNAVLREALVRGGFIDAGAAAAADEPALWCGRGGAAGAKP